MFVTAGAHNPASGANHGPNDPSRTIESSTTRNGPFACGNAAIRQAARRFIVQMQIGSLERLALVSPELRAHPLSIKDAGACTAA